MKKYKGTIFLVRDGTLNEMVINQDHGTIDSPLHEDQVKLFARIPETLLKLSKLGYQLFILTN